MRMNEITVIIVFIAASLIKPQILIMRFGLIESAAMNLLCFCYNAFRQIILSFRSIKHHSLIDFSNCSFNNSFIHSGLANSNFSFLIHQTAVFLVSFIPISLIQFWFHSPTFNQTSLKIHRAPLL